MDWLNASKAATATVGNSWPDIASKLDTTGACFHAALHSVVNVSFGVEGTLLRRTTRTLEGAEAVSLPTISASCVIVMVVHGSAWQEGCVDVVHGVHLRTCHVARECARAAR